MQLALTTLPIQRDPGHWQEQRENFANLREVISESIDNPPTQEQIEQAIAALQDIVSDGEITSEEWQRIFLGARQAAENLGIEAAETHDIILAAQAIVTDSRLPQPDEDLTGTSGSDWLWGKGGNDTLKGVGDDLGRGDIDVLWGGAGSDTFILGDGESVFYNDGFARSQGAQDFALAVDFNPASDLIQLHGTAADYSLGSLPDSLQASFPDLEGTGLYAGSELIGVLYGVEVTSFESGFSFV